jgi:hypothetical protein
MLKLINISGSPIGLIKMVDGQVTQENVDPGDYRVVSELTPQMRRLADPTLKIIKIKEEVTI